jgi:hypothetical protein
MLQPQMSAMIAQFQQQQQPQLQQEQQLSTASTVTTTPPPLPFQVVIIKYVWFPAPCRFYFLLALIFPLTKSSGIPYALQLAPQLATMATMAQSTFAMPGFMTGTGAGVAAPMVPPLMQPAHFNPFLGMPPAPQVGGAPPVAPVAAEAPIRNVAAAAAPAPAAAVQPPAPQPQAAPLGGGAGGGALGLMAQANPDDEFGEGNPEAPQNHLWLLAKLAFAVVLFSQNASVHRMIVLNVVAILIFFFQTGMIRIRWVQEVVALGNANGNRNGGEANAAAAGVGVEGVGNNEQNATNGADGM